MMWLTLAIMFLAGTNRVNLFSLGYLIGAFVFLWMGSDLYLRDIRVIHKWYFNISFNLSIFVSKQISSLNIVYPVPGGMLFWVIMCQSSF